MVEARTYAYVGAWPKSEHEDKPGIGIFEYQADSGDLVSIGHAAAGIRVGALAVDSRLGMVYCVDEVTTHDEYFADQDFRGHEFYRVGGGGRVVAFRVRDGGRHLEEVSRVRSMGSFPCDVAPGADGRFLAVANHSNRVPVTKVVASADGFDVVLEYDDATTVLFSLGNDGSIGDVLDVVVHSGNGGPLARQTHAQIHSVSVSPSGRILVACDKGNDRLFVFKVGAEVDRLAADPPDGVPVIAGSSPRYSVFHPRLPLLFVNYETRAIVTAFSYDEDGVLTELRTVSSLPDEVPDNLTMMQSDLKIHPSGETLYTLLRGINAVTVFRIDEAGGMDRIQTVKVDGQGPRGCAVSPDGRYFYVGAVSSNTVFVWEIQNDGTLVPSNLEIGFPCPGSLIFLSPSTDDVAVSGTAVADPLTARADA